MSYLCFLHIPGRLNRKTLTIPVVFVVPVVGLKSSTGQDLKSTTKFADVAGLEQAKAMGFMTRENPSLKLRDHTVDGSEIRRSPVEGKVVYLIFTRFHTSQVVVWDF